ncbi:hypothetical protein C8J56DRAFT_760190, partial [Mycena floridula]
KKIGILIVGEAHLNEEQLKKIKRLFSRCLKIWYSKDPDSDNAKGIAVVFNKELTNINNVRVKEIIAGQVMLA